MKSSTYILLQDLLLAISFIFISVYITSNTEDIFINISSNHWIINITILIIGFSISTFLINHSFRIYNQDLIFDWSQHIEHSFILENIKELSERDKTRIIQEIENENTRSLSTSSKSRIVLIKNILIGLFFTLFITFIAQISSAYFKLQNAIHSSKQLDNQIINALPKATLIEGIPDVATITLITSIIAALGIISAQTVAWRIDRRNKDEEKLKKIETNLRIEKLELEIKELKAKEEEKNKIIKL